MLFIIRIKKIYFFNYLFSVLFGNSSPKLFFLSVFNKRNENENVVKDNNNNKINAYL